MKTPPKKPTKNYGVLVLAGVLFACAMAYWAYTEIGVVSKSATVLKIDEAAPSINKQVKLSKIQLATPTCTNTCVKARDGVCDDGRRQPLDDEKSVPVLCDLGTDCVDCGPWNEALPSWPGGTPVQFITDASTHNATIKMRLTHTQPSFLMPITQWEKDPDVSAMLEHHGALEGGVTRVMYEILKERCKKASGEPALVLDVGANLGYFALYAAVMGCRVIAWEPIELFRAFLSHGVAINKVSHLVEIRSTAISDTKQEVTVGIPKDGTYWGLASVDNLNLQPREVKATVKVPAERLDAAIPKGTDVLLLKVDVEGYEPSVIRSAAKLFEEKRVAEILLEYSPGIPERSKDYEAMLELPRTLESLHREDFAIAHLPLRFATPWPPKLMPDHYKDPIPGLEEVTAGNLARDVKAVKMRMKEKDGSCPVPDELKVFGPWKNCNEWAYAVHPKGFRSAFGFNTNLWLTQRSLAGASLNKTAQKGVTWVGRMPLEGQASLFDEDQDMKVWTSAAHPGQSIGFMKCDGGIGASHKTIFRCPCGDDKGCADEMKVVQKLLDEGKMPMQNW